MAARQWQGCEFKESKGSKVTDTNTFDTILKNAYQGIFTNLLKQSPWDRMMDPRFAARDKAMRIRHRYMRRRDDQVES